MVYQSSSSDQTQEIGRELAQKYRDGGILAFSGELGAGKTTLIQGFARGLRIKERLLSPTFVIMREHDIPGYPMGKLYHIDLYRLNQVKEIESLGLSEIFANPENIVLIEWAEKMGDLLPKNAVRIQIEITSENTREITVSED